MTDALDDLQRLQELEQRLRKQLSWSRGYGALDIVDQLMRELYVLLSRRNAYLRKLEERISRLEDST